MQKNINCQFSLAIMSDDFKNKILNAIKHVDTTNIKSQTDALSTTYHGPKHHVLTALKTCFVATNDQQTHITCEATISSSSTPSHTPPSPTSPVPTTKFQTLAQIAYHPLGIINYIDHITHIQNQATLHNLSVTISNTHNIQLTGDVGDIFNYINEIITYSEQNTPQYTIQLKLSINSPTKPNTN